LHANIPNPAKRIKTDLYIILCMIITYS